MLEVVFSSFWTWLGTWIIVSSVAYSMSLPFYWYTKSLEQRRLLEEQARFYRFYDQRN